MSASPVVESPLSAHAPRFNSDFTNNTYNNKSTSMATAVVASPSPVPSTSSSLSFVVPPSTTTFARTEFTPAAPPSKRPKLSLNTTSLPATRTLGKGNTGLRLDTVATSTTSPTLRNTYRNAYGSSSTSTLTQTTKNNDSDDERPHTPIPQGTLAHSFETSLPSSVESSPELRPVPYSRLSSLRSVLKNSPLPHLTPRGVRARLFPPHKSVQMSAVVEEITNKVYTRTHADMSSDDDSHCASERCVRKRCSTSPLDDRIHPLRLKVASHENDDEDDVEENDDQPLAKTPVAGRARKRREWIWTLDSPPKVADQSIGTVEKDKSTLADGYS